MNFKKYMLLTSCLVSLNAANAGGFETIIVDLKESASKVGVKMSEELYDFELSGSLSTLRNEYETRLGHKAANAVLYFNNSEDQRLYELKISHWDDLTSPEATLTHKPITMLWSITPANEIVIKPEHPVERAYANFIEAEYLVALKMMANSLNKHGQVLCSPAFPDTMHPAMQALRTKTMKEVMGFTSTSPEGKVSPVTPAELAQVRSMEGEALDRELSFSRVKDSLFSDNFLGHQYKAVDFPALTEEEKLVHSTFNKELGHASQDFALSVESNESSKNSSDLLYTLKLSYWGASKEFQETKKNSHVPFAIVWSLTPPEQGLTVSQIQKEMIAGEIKKASYISSLRIFKNLMDRNEIDSYVFGGCSQEAQPYLTGLGMKMLKSALVSKIVTADGQFQASDIELLAEVRPIQSSSSSSTTSADAQDLDAAAMERLEEEQQRLLDQQAAAQAAPAPDASAQ